MTSPNKETLLRLAERVEAATGPDRELDVAIVYALHPDIGRYEGQCIGDPPIFWHDPYRKQPCPKFTASLDAAMGLVPEGVWDHLKVYQPDHYDELWEVHLCRNANLRKPVIRGVGRSHALALTATALRALATQANASTKLRR